MYQIQVRPCRQRRKDDTRLSHLATTHLLPPQKLNVALESFKSTRYCATFDPYCVSRSDGMYNAFVEETVALRDDKGLLDCCCT